MSNANKMVEFTENKRYQFHAKRIMKGNPVKGRVINVSAEWVEVELEKDIEGMINHWEKGEVKAFRKELISQIKELPG